MGSKVSKFILFLFYIFVIIFFYRIYNLYKNMNTDVIKVEKIEIVETDISLQYGEKYKIEYDIKPINATIKSLIWESSNPNLVDVDKNGNLFVKGNANGEVIITATSKTGDASTSIKVKVTGIKVTGIKINKTTVSLKYGASTKINTTIFPSNAANKKVIWTSSNAGLVSVDSNGNIKAVGNTNGEAIITVKTVDGGYSASVKVKITKVNKIIKVTGVKLDKSSVNLKYGDVIKLNTTISPNNATNKNVTWSSSDTSLVTVDGSGNIKAVGNKNGNATITVKTVDGEHSVSCAVKVTKLESTIRVTNVRLDKSTVSLKYGTSIKLSVIISPSNATNKSVTWTSSNPSLVTVDSKGNVKAVGNKDGSATITVKSADGGYSASTKIKVSKVINVTKVTGIKLDKSTVNLKYGTSIKISAVISPNNATNKNVTWTSSNTSLVTVDGSGNIKAVGNKDGTATVTAKTADGGYNANIKVTVSSIKATGVSLNKSSVTLQYGSSTKLTATVKPSNAANKSVTWASSNTSLVTVDSSGNVKAVGNKNGSATITVKTKDGGYSASVKVTVTSIKVTGVKLNKSSLTLLYGKSAKLTATISPSNAANKDVTWTSSDTSLVTVDSSGNIKAKSGKIGKAVITVKTKDGGYTAKCTVKIFPNNNYIVFSGSYTNYKNNMLLKRKKAVMQSFAIHDNYLYISQQQASNAGGYLSKINMKDIKNVSGEGQQFFNNIAILENYGHLANIDIEVTNGVPYLWTGCSVDNASVDYNCRINLNTIKFGSTPLLQNPSVSIKVAGSNLVAVDSDNRTIVTMTNKKNVSKTKVHVFNVYNLDDYIKNKEKATLIRSFEIDNGNSNYHRQGFDVYGNYIYSYEGNKSNSVYDSVFLSVITLDGNVVVKRKKINYPDNNYYWEPEGVKVYNGKIYIGFGREDKKTNYDTAHIYKLN